MLRERATSWQLGLGVGWLPTSQATPMWAAGQHGGWWPAPVCGGRGGLGLESRWGLGPVAGREDWVFPNGEAMARGAWIRGDQLRFGPSAGLGLLWRLPTDHDPQLGPLVAAGLHTELAFDRIWLALDPELHMVPLDESPSVYPSLGLSAGLSR